MIMAPHSCRAAVLRTAHQLLYRVRILVQEGVVMPSDLETTELLTLTAQIVSAHVSSNSVGADALPELITDVYRAMAGLGTEAPAPAERPQPAVPIKKSIFPDYIVCLEDGKKLK